MALSTTKDSYLHIVTTGHERSLYCSHADYSQSNGKDSLKIDFTMVVDFGEFTGSHGGFSR